MTLSRIARAYCHARRLRFADRAALSAHQERELARFRQRVLVRSPYFAPWLSAPMSSWPKMDKGRMMAGFDRMNTAGLRLADVWSCAMQAEVSRDFRPMLHGYSAGLSSGTSGSRAVFVASPRERAQWAGIMLAKLLPRGLLHKERVALFLRSGNSLYSTLRNPCLSFEFFDLFTDFEKQLDRLARYGPTIVVAPAQVLRALALEKLAGRLVLDPVKVISAAEVLDPQDRVPIAEAFGEPGEIYQATEGFLGSTCPHGTLHLNEEFIQVEPEWIDDHRFVPVITDFTRSTQPIVRYRLDDVLVRQASACPCGSPTLALARIEGRCDDTLLLPGRRNRPVTVFADVLSRALAQILPPAADYRLVQADGRSLGLYVSGGAALPVECQARLETLLDQLGVATPELRWALHNNVPPSDFTAKRRRIIRLRQPGKQT